MLNKENPFESFPMSRSEIVIKARGGYTPEGAFEDVVCVGCSATVEPDPTGPNLSMEGLLYRPVCDACGEKYAPSLMALVKLARAAFDYYNYDPLTEPEPGKKLEAAALEYIRVAPSAFYGDEDDDEDGDKDEDVFGEK